MITLPWQVVVAFVGIVALVMVINYLKRVDCQEKIDAARRDERRDAIAAYKEAWRAGWVNGGLLAEEVKKSKGKGNA